MQKKVLLFLPIQFLGDVFATITIIIYSLAEPDICKAYAHAIDLLC